MARRPQTRSQSDEAPEPIKRALAGMILYPVSILLLILIFVIVEHFTDPRVLMFDFLFR